jgi:hypothetical protein
MSGIMFEFCPRGFVAISLRTFHVYFFSCFLEVFYVAIEREGMELPVIREPADETGVDEMRVDIRVKCVDSAA